MLLNDLLNDLMRQSKLVWIPFAAMSPTWLHSIEEQYTHQKLTPKGFHVDKKVLGQTMLHPLQDLGIQTLTSNPVHATTITVVAAGFTNVMVLRALSALLPEITLSKDVAHSFTVSPPTCFIPDRFSIFCDRQVDFHELSCRHRSCSFTFPLHCGH